MDKQYIETMGARTFVDWLPNREFLRQPLVFEKAESVYLWDIHGKRYYDAIGGTFVTSLGHQHPRLKEAMKRQMDRLTFVPPLHGISDIVLQFIDKYSSMTPGNLNFIKTYSGGSESIESAIKFVRQYFKQTGHPQKTKVISNYLSYHGATLGALAAGGGNRKLKFEPEMPGFIKCYNPKQLRDHFSSWEETCRYAANLVRLTIESEMPETVAAFLVEPICNTAGVIAPTEEYFQIIRKACDDYNVMLIYDEVLTGIGKTGDLFAAVTYGVIPDIICSGKGLSSGMVPMGSMVAREDMASAFDGEAADELFFAHGQTYGNFPLAAAVGLEVLNVIEDDHLFERTRVMSKEFFSRFHEMKEKYGCIREVRGRGILIGVEFCEDPVTLRPYPAGRKLGDAFKKECLKNGLIVRNDADWFGIAPPLIATDDQVDELCNLIETSLKSALDEISGN